VAEQRERPGPEPLKLSAELIDDPSASPNEILPCSGQRPNRLRAIGVGLKYPEAVMIGTRELAQHERVKPI